MCSGNNSNRKTNKTNTKSKSNSHILSCSFYIHAMKNKNEHCNDCVYYGGKKTPKRDERMRFVPIIFNMYQIKILLNTR